MFGLKSSQYLKSIEVKNSPPVFRQLLENELRYFENFNGMFSSLIVVISKKI